MGFEYDRFPIVQSRTQGPSQENGRNRKNGILRSDDREITSTNEPVAGDVNETDGLAQGRDTGLTWSASDRIPVVMT